jgi:hypothetical protein
MRGEDVMVAVPRFSAKEITLSFDGKWTNAFTGEVVEGEVEVFKNFPVAMLTRAR